MSVVLEVVSAPNSEMLPLRAELKVGAAAIIGRNADCDLQLLCPNKTVSRKHGEIYCEGNAYYLVDHSANGVFLNHNGEAIGASQHYLLQSGDLLDIGPFTVMVTIPVQTSSVALPLGALGEEPTASENAPIPEPDADLFNQSISFSKPLLPEVEELAFDDESLGAGSELFKTQKDFGDIGDQFTPPSMAIPADWDLDPESLSNTEPAQPAKGQVVKFASRNTKLVEALLEGMGLDPERSEHVNVEAMKQLGQSLRAALDGYLATRDEVREVKSKLSFDKISIERQKESDPLGSINSTDKYLELLLDTHNPGHGNCSQNLQHSVEHCIEDVADVLSVHKATTETFYNALSPEAILEALVVAQQQSDTSLSLSKINDGFSSSARKWVFFQRNWKKLFAHANVAIKKDFEAKFLLSHARRMGAKGEAK